MCFLFRAAEEDGPELVEGFRGDVSGYVSREGALHERHQETAQHLRSPAQHGDGEARRDNVLYIQL